MITLLVLIIFSAGALLYHEERKQRRLQEKMWRAAFKTIRARLVYPPGRETLVGELAKEIYEAVQSIPIDSAPYRCYHVAARAALEHVEKRLTAETYWTTLPEILKPKQDNWPSLRGRHVALDREQTFADLKLSLDPQDPEAYTDLDVQPNQEETPIM